MVPYPQKLKQCQQRIESIQEHRTIHRWKNEARRVDCGVAPQWVQSYNIEEQKMLASTVSTTSTLGTE